MSEKLEDGIIKRSDGYAFSIQTGEYLEIKRYGLLKGMIEFDQRIDLSQPIYEQVSRLKGAESAHGRLPRRRGRVS